jgi:uncharacterized protein YcbX
MTRLDSLVAYPIKSLDGVTVEQAALGPNGVLRGDRSYALVEAGVDPATASVGGGGGYVNGKSEPAIHRLRASYELAGPADATPTTVTLERPATGDVTADTATFILPEERDALAAWVGAYLGYAVDLARDPGGFPDDRAAPGPTVTSVGTLEAVASWFDAVADAHEVRRRFRPNIVLADCPAFFEDHLFSDHGEAVRCTAGEATVLGVNPCQRCVVPSRHPDTGEPLEEFRPQFVEQRRETRPSWTETDRFDHDFRLMVNTVVPEASWGTIIGVGDPVCVTGTVPFDG